MNKSLYYAIFLGVTAILVTTVAYFGYQITNPIIEQNRIDKINQSISLLYSEEDGYFSNSDLAENSYQEKKYKVINAVYEVLDSDGEIHALIYDVSSQGKNGIVSALIAVDPYNDVVTKVTYYDHSETPNIGEKYTRDEHINTLIGQPLSNVVVDVIANASTTWVAIENMFNAIEEHYAKEGVHINE